MKDYPYFSIIVGLVLLATLGLSCNANKTTTASMNILIITLEESINGNYLKQQYADFNIMDVKKSNKTLNQYQTSFNCSTSKLISLKELLAEDVNVVSFLDTENRNSKVESSKNVNHAKTKSIRKNN